MKPFYIALLGIALLDGLGVWALVETIRLRLKVLRRTEELKAACGTPDTE